jgi:hypothetical protein
LYGFSGLWYGHTKGVNRAVLSFGKPEIFGTEGKISVDLIQLATWHTFYLCSSIRIYGIFYHFTFGKNLPGLASINAFPVDFHPDANLLQHFCTAIIHLSRRGQTDTQGEVAVARNIFEQSADNCSGIINKTWTIKPVSNGTVGYPCLVGFDSFREEAFKSSSDSLVRRTKFDDGQFVDLPVIVGSRLVVKMGNDPCSCI